MNIVYVLNQEACIRWESVIQLIAPQTVSVKTWDTREETSPSDGGMLLLELPETLTPMISQINNDCIHQNISIVCVIDEFDENNQPVIQFLQQAHVEGYFSSYFTLDKLRSLLF